MMGKVPGQVEYPVVAPAQTEPQASTAQIGAFGSGAVSRVTRNQDVFFYPRIAPQVIELPEHIALREFQCRPGDRPKSEKHSGGRNTQPPQMFYEAPIIPFPGTLSTPSPSPLS